MRFLSPGSRTLGGVFLVGLATLMLEVTLTRIFSVTMWYHFAFMAVSLALFGISAGGIYVYILPHRFPRESLDKQLTLFSALFSISTVISLALLLSIPFPSRLSPLGIANMGIIYLVAMVPFLLGGLCITLALTHLSRNVSRVYFADLIGAGTGAVLAIVFLSFLSGPSAIIAIAGMAALATLLFSTNLPSGRAVARSGMLVAAVATLLLLNGEYNLFHIDVVKGENERDKGRILERWNPFSRIAVFVRDSETPFGWGLSPLYQGSGPQELLLNIDGQAGTPITQFDGDLKKVDYLQYDVTFMAHYLKRNADVLVIGPGGGRDVLAALLFGQRDVTGAEINPTIVGIVKDDLKEFTGSLYSRPDVHIQVSDGRSYLQRSDARFDIIQASLTDTWAATSAGAFALSENNLYTTEAFNQYYQHLKDDGILTMSRYYTGGRPAETIRLVSLALASWEGMGVPDPSRNIMVVASDYGVPIGTLILKKSPFSQEEIQRIEDVSRQLGFQVVYTPLSSSNEYFQKLISSEDPRDFWRTYDLDVSPPTDDKPFFFHVLRLRDFLHPAEKGGALRFNNNAIVVLGALLIIVILLTAIFIFAPLWLHRRKGFRPLGGSASFLWYFALLGLGFILVEIPLIQRFILFLGNPTYALSVVLFSLLIFSGTGSLLTTLFPPQRVSQGLAIVLIALGVLLALYSLFLPDVLKETMGLATPYRVLIAVLWLLPLGLLMGMPFPLGIKLLDRSSREIIPWVWGINGATSVLASVLAIVISISYGFTYALLAGQVAYLASLLTVLVMRGAEARARRKQQSEALAGQVPVPL